VELTNVATNTRRVFSTNEAGLYNLPQLQPGTYNLKIETAGFKAQERAGITLQVGQVARIDFTLEGARKPRRRAVRRAPAAGTRSDGQVCAACRRRFPRT
jgi:hypothetical protein